MDDWDDDDYDDDGYDDYGGDYDDDTEDLYITCPDCGVDVYEDSPNCPHCGWFVTQQSGWNPSWFLGGANQMNWRMGVSLMIISAILIGILMIKF